MFKPTLYFQIHFTKGYFKMKTILKFVCVKKKKITRKIRNLRNNVQMLF